MFDHLNKKISENPKEKSCKKHKNQLKKNGRKNKFKIFFVYNLCLYLYDNIFQINLQYFAPINITKKSSYFHKKLIKYKKLRK